MNSITPEEILKLKDSKYLPACTEETFKLYTENHTDNIDSMSTSAKLATTIVDAASSNCNLNDIGMKRTMDDMVNVVDVDGNKLSMSVLKLAKKANSSKAALLKFKKKAGFGAPVKIDLWHSGFWIKVQPLDDEAIINLEFAINDKVNEIGKKTRTIGYSHYEVLIAELILDAAIDNIIATSLKLEENTNIKEFININDIQIIAWGLAYTLFPDGWQGVVPCKNTAVLNDDGVAKCSNFNVRKIDMGELFYKDLSKLDTDQKLQMAKSSVGSVELMDALTYQSTAVNAGVVTKTYSVNDFPIDITFMSPTSDMYFTYGNKFLTDLEEATNEAVLNKDNVSKENARNRIMGIIELQVFNHFVDKITVTDDEGVTTITSLPDVNDWLEIILTDLDAGQQFLNDISTYIHRSIVASIGAPSFYCDECKEKHEDSEYIPLSVYSYFFILLRSKYSQLLTRLQTPKKSISVDN